MTEKNIIGWESTRVGDIADLLRGITYKKEQASNTPKAGYKPVLRANNINGSLNFDDLVYVPEQNISEQQFLKSGDIVFAMSSGSKHLVGKSAQAKLDFNGSYGAFCAALRTSKLVSKDYVYYVFQGNNFRRLISEIAKGSNINNLKREHILDFEISLPPIAEQHRIVAKIEELFSELDRGIENLKTAREQLKVYRQALLKHAFEGKLTAQWREERRATKSVAPAKAGAQPLNGMDSRLRGNDERRGGNDEPLETADALLVRIQTEREQRYQQQLQQWQTTGGSKPKAPKPLPPLTAEELSAVPELPEEWGWARLANIGIIETGTTPSKDNPENFGNEFPFFKPTDLEAGSNVRLAREYLSKSGLSQSRFIPANSTLVTCIGATIGKVGITRVDGASNQQINSIIPFEAVLPDFVYYQASGPGFQDAVKSNASSTTLPILNKSKFEMLRMAVCSHEEQQQIVLELESKLSEADQLDLTLTASLQQAEALRQSILKRAFSGQLVAQDADDEPAAALLARIKAEKQLQGHESKKASRSKRNG